MVLAFPSSVELYEAYLVIFEWWALSDHLGAFTFQCTCQSSGLAYLHALNKVSKAECGTPLGGAVAYV